MKFNKQTNEKQRVLDLIKKAHLNKNFELEALIYYQGLEKLIKYDDFISCLKRLKGQKGFKLYPSVEVININFKGDSKYKNIRISVSGKETIKFFCANGKLKDLGSNIKYYHKENIIDETGKINRVNIEDYNIRFNLKEERPMDEGNELIRDLLSHWDEVPKFFRYKKIISFETEDGLFRNDFAIVKESKNETREMSVADVRKHNLEELVVKPENVRIFKDWWNRMKTQPKSMVNVSNQPVYYQSFQKSGTLENKPYYEIEVEYLGNQKGQKTLGEHDILVKFVELIGVHLQAIQHSYYIISKSEIASVKYDFQNLTETRGKNIFKAPLPNTVELNHLEQLTNRQYLDETNHTIRKNFFVTEKADGERQLLFIDSHGEFFFINRQSIVRKLGIKMPELAATLLDGEFLEDKNLYMIFDVYFFQGKATWREIFEPRYEVMKKASLFLRTNIEKPSSSMEVKNQMMFGHKVFYRGDTVFNKNPSQMDESSHDTLIFDVCKKILNQVNVKQGGLLEIGHQFSYNVDGLIFVPSNLYVGQDDLNHNINNFTEAANWMRTYKWKPPINNSIDFEIRVFHPKGPSSTNDEYYNGQLYRQVILYVNYQSDFHFRYNAQRTLNEGLGAFNGLQPFSPNFPFIGYKDHNNQLVEEGSIAWIPVNNTGSMITYEGSLVQDGDVIEFSYDLNSKLVERCWKPLRHRPGKGANGYHTAMNIWRSIHNPITTKMIIGTEDIPDNDMYYQSNVERGELYLFEMNKFHNFVKKRLFDHIGKDKKRPNILDLACGKFGDYYKWIPLNPNFVLGIEYSQDNINNYKNGAATRALIAEEDNQKLKKLNSNVMVVWGDCSKPINTGEAAMDDLNKYYLNVLYGDVDITDYNKLGKLSGKALQKFDITTCHFAIHYFFAGYDNLNGFLNNVYQSLKTNGFFIGTCLDGKSIYNKFKTTKKNVLEEYQPATKDMPEKSQLIWRIKKDYEDTHDDKGEMPDDETSLGMKISVDVESINKTSHEYLVNFDYLVKLMSEYGFDLVDSKLFHEVPSSMLEEFYAENKIFGPKLRNKPKVLEYSILHRWFIFVKRNIQSDSSDENKESPDEGLTINEKQEIENPYVSTKYSPEPKPKLETETETDIEETEDYSVNAEEDDDEKENNQKNIELDIKELALESVAL